jgi:thioredoxin-like negative regulator of GroEL
LLERLLVLAAIGVLLASLGILARARARARLQTARSAPPETFWDAIKEGPDGRPLVIAFSTPSCAACHTAQKPALTRLEARAGGTVRIVEVDAAAQPEVARRFGILTVPSTAVLDGEGRVLALNQGFASTERLAGQLTEELTAKA